jgi:nucleoside 2-deoxyribosyltransferase
MMYDIYLAGPFFTEWETSIIDQVTSILRNRGFKVFVPKEHFVPDGENIPNSQWGEAVFEMDKEALENSQCVVAVYHGMYSDSGTAWEIGYAYALRKKILIVCVTHSESSLMVANGSASVMDGISGLREFDFDSFPRKTSITEQK